MLITFPFKHELTNCFAFSLSYPGCCVFKTLPTSFPSREADNVTTAFIADIHARVPTICGTAVKYSGKALTPLAALQPAFGYTKRHPNLKPVELIPELDISQFPIPPRMRISRPAAGTAELPSESASFGQQPHSSQENCNHTALPKGASQGASATPTITKQSTAVSLLDCDLCPGTQSSFLQQSIHPALNMPPQLGAGGRSTVSMAVNSAPPKVVPLFGVGRAVAIHQLQVNSGSNKHKQTLSSLKGRGSFSDITNNGQPPAKKLRFNLPSQSLPTPQPNTISQQQSSISVTTPTVVPALASGAQNGVQQPMTSAQVSGHKQQQFMPGAKHVAANVQDGSINKIVVVSQENQQTQKQTVRVTQKSSAETTRSAVLPKEPVIVDGVSNEIIKKVSIIIIAIEHAIH